MNTEEGIPSRGWWMARRPEDLTVTREPPSGDPVPGNERTLAQTVPGYSQNVARRLPEPVRSAPKSFDAGRHHVRAGPLHHPLQYRDHP